MHDTFSAFLAPLLKTIRDNFDISYGLAGSLAVFVQLPTVLNPLIGYIADRTNLKYLIIFAPAVTATLMSLIGYAPNYATLVLLLIAAGFSVASFHAPAGGLIGAIAGNRVGTGMSIFMAAGEMGRTLGPILVVWGVARYGFEGIWRLAVLGWLVSAILFWRLHSIQTKPRAAGSGTFQELLPRLLDFFPVLCILLLSRAFMVAASTTYLPTYMEEVAGTSFQFAGWSLSILEGASVIGALSSGTFSDRFGRKNILRFLFILAPIALLALINSPNYLIIPLLILLGLTAITHTPVYLAMVQDRFADNRALANGVFIAVSFLIRAIGIQTVGFLADAYSLQTAYLIAALIGFSAIAGLALLKTK